MTNLKTFTVTILPTSLHRLLLAGSISAILAGCQSAKKPAATALSKNDDRAAETAAIPAASINRASVLVDLTGGDLGVGGGFLIAAAPDKIQARDHAQAMAAAQMAEASPVSPELVHEQGNADLNHDGFITLDEILAMVRSGLNDMEIADRLDRTHYVFHLTPQQERYLTDRGVSQNLVGVLHGLTAPNVSPVH